jgi:hypothetical protein
MPILTDPNEIQKARELHARCTGQNPEDIPQDAIFEFEELPPGLVLQKGEDIPAT